MLYLRVDGNVGKTSLHFWQGESKKCRGRWAVCLAVPYTSQHTRWSALQEENEAVFSTVGTERI